MLFFQLVHGHCFRPDPNIPEADWDVPCADPPTPKMQCVITVLHCAKRRQRRVRIRDGESNYGRVPPVIDGRLLDMHAYSAAFHCLNQRWGQH